MENLDELKIQIRNFQAIQKADLVFKPGLNIIVGDTNNGKTSFTRAVKGVVANTITDDQINDQVERVDVKIGYRGNTVHYKRDKSLDSKVAYMVNDKVYTKIGRSILPEAQEALNIREVVTLDSKRYINFIDQWAVPFSIDESGSQLYQLIVNSEDESKLVEAIKLAKQDSIKIDQDLSYSLRKIDEINLLIKSKATALDDLRGSTDVTDRILDLDVLNRKERIIRDLFSEGSTLVKQRKEFSQRLSVINRGLEIQLPTGLEKLIELEGLFNEVDSIREKRNYEEFRLSKISIVPEEELKLIESKIETYINKERAVKEQEQLLAQYTEINKRKVLEELSLRKVKVINFSLEEEHILKVSSLVKTVDEYNMVVGDLSKLRSLVIRVNDNLEKVNLELSEFKVCPTCGGEIK